MAKKSRPDSHKRDGSTFVAMPHIVLHSAAFTRLGHPAKSLLWEIALQVKGDNNGDLELTQKTLGPRGWTSNDVLYRARDELVAAGFIVETRKGKRPNVPTLFAVTWRDLDHCGGKLELEPKNFPRGAYNRAGTLPISAKNIVKKKILTPPDGLAAPSIAPPPGVESTATTPPDGAIRAVFDPRLHRQTVTYLGLPSDAERAAVNA